MLSSLLAQDDLADQIASISLSRGLDDRYPDEPLLKSNTKRFVLFPIVWGDLWHAYKDAEAKFWGAEEIKLTADVDDWDSPKLSKRAKDFILRALTLLASEPSLYGQDLTETVIQQFSEVVQVLEARCMYGYMMFSRNIYRELFSLCLEVYGTGFDERKKVFEEVRDKIASHKATGEWLRSYALDDERSFAERNVALTCWHHIHNCSAMAALFHLFAAPGPAASGPGIGATPRKANLGAHAKPQALPGLIHGLQKINGDFERYTQYDALIQSHLVKQPSKEFAEECVRKAAELEVEALKDLLGMDASEEGLLLGSTPMPSVAAFEQYIQFRADEVLVSLGYAKTFKTDNPFTWLDTVSVERDQVAATPASHKVTKTPMSVKTQMIQSPAGPQTPTTSRKETASNFFTLDADF